MSLPNEMAPEDCRLVATVTRAFHCANKISEGETFVFDHKGILLAGDSSANLCIGMICKLQPVLMMAQDRLAEGLHPIGGYAHFDCFDTGIDHGGTGKVYVEMSLVDARTGKTVPRPE